ncbi:MAG: GNAT family N-acetyltransferase [Candidatus Lindowbacteria bacterium]|nr:GNAT family N-acetyltransferase [Candidatus Lindowbacteria bacterium]
MFSTHIIDPKEDIYFQEEYIKLHLNDGDEIFSYTCEENGKLFRNISIKRPITQIGSKTLESGLFDLETPYGYGGYFSNTSDQDFVERSFCKLRELCSDQNIVAEFVRFHPFNQFPRQHQKQLVKIEPNRHAVFVDLETKISDGYSSSLTRNLKSAKEHGLTVEEADFESGLDTFIPMYIKTMERNRAGKFYFLPREYFDELGQLKASRLFFTRFENQIINGFIILESKPMAYYHLGATHPDFYALHPNPFLFDFLIRKYQSQGYLCFYLGGGNKSTPEDTLFKFKKKFSNTVLDYYIWGTVFRRQDYNRLNQIAEAEYGTLPDIYLKYRYIPNEMNF